MLYSTGTIHYDDTDGHRITLLVDQGLANYYRSLIPKTERVIKPRWDAHITVVRPEYEIPPKIRYWGDYEGLKVEFPYDPYLLNGNGYYWINVWSLRLEAIRTELGLENFSRYPMLPKGYSKTFHITVGKYEEIFPMGEAPEK